MSHLGKGDLDNRTQFNTIYWHCLQPLSRMMIGTSKLNSKWIPIEEKKWQRIGNWKKTLEASALGEDERNLITLPKLRTQRHNANDLL